MNNGQQLQESVESSNLFDKRVKEMKRIEAGEIKCVQRIRDFQESMFDLLVLDCTS